MKGQMGGFQNQRVWLQVFPSILPLPTPSFLFLLSPHFSCGQNAEKPVLRSLLHGNACYAGYTDTGLIR